MENQEKIFEQFKQASENIESKEFPSVEKVWSRVEEKLDKKVLTKQNNLWKKIAIAASVLLFVTLAYQILKPEPQIAPQKNEVTLSDTLIPTKPTAPQNPIVDAEIPSPQIKKEAGKILQQQIEKPTAVAVQENIQPDIVATEKNPDDDSDVVLKSKKASAPISRPGRFQKGRAFDAIGISRKDSEAPAIEADKKSEAQIIGNAQAPLVIVDGKAITGKEALGINSITDGIAKIDPKDEKEIVVLKEPLYIINGHYYTEQDLFGPNPTSPYAPLNQQEIETISVLQGEKAIANYGKRGEKGVVIITTKDRKPAVKTSIKASTDKAK
jgi:TonB-dependent SusC/RagA subfamily outer membrane receptor